MLLIGIIRELLNWPTMLSRNILHFSYQETDNKVYNVYPELPSLDVTSSATTHLAYCPLLSCHLL